MMNNPDMDYGSLGGRPVRMTDTAAWVWNGGRWHLLPEEFREPNIRLLSQFEFQEAFGDLPEPE
jgi:hypothetical protein